VQPKTSREEWQKRVERWRDSGLTAEQFAGELGINAGTLKFWGYKLGKESREAATTRAPRTRPATASSFVEVRAELVASAFEVEFGNGRRLRVPATFDASVLERLLPILERA
jgi:transposase-like protein